MQSNHRPMSAPGASRHLPVMQQIGRDRVEGGHRADIVTRAEVARLCSTESWTVWRLSEREAFQSRCAPRGC